MGEPSTAGAGAPAVSKRDLIVAAAAAVIGRRGYGDTSLKQIAREAKVAPGLLHYYFESKEALLLEIVSSLEREMVGDWQGVVVGIDDPLERISAALDHAATRCAERPEFFRLLFDLYLVGLSNPAILERSRHMTNAFIDDVESEVNSVLGKLPPGGLPVSPRALATVIVGSINGIALMTLVDRDDPRPLYDAFKTLLLALGVAAYAATADAPAPGS